ncbi:hypothetical protein KCU76_g6, partial [Aureobasidium melanogenum]
MASVVLLLSVGVAVLVEVMHQVLFKTKVEPPVVSHWFPFIQCVSAYQGTIGMYGSPAANNIHACAPTCSANIDCVGIRSPHESSSSTESAIGKPEKPVQPHLPRPARTATTLISLRSRLHPGTDFALVMSGRSAFA